MTKRPCPNDAMLIPQVAEDQSGTEPVRFFWCWSCMELFAFIGDIGRLAASFGWNREGGGWCLFSTHGAERDVKIAIAAVTKIGPQKLRTT